MRSRATRGAARRLLVLAGLVVPAGTGCAGLFSHYDIAPSGLIRRDDDLRRLLVAGSVDSALARVAPEGEAAPDDELLRSLYAGILGHYAGAYDSSSAALQRAADLTEDRYTKSVSRSLLSLVSNDKTLPYEPGWTERLLIHYYGAFNRLRQNDVDGAAVEARRLGFLLEREAERDRDGRTTPTLALLRYFTGAVFEAAGDRNDAEVAYRNALALAGRDEPLPTEVLLADSLGEVVVVVERSFVAHRVEQAIVAPLHPVELDWLTGTEGDERASAAAMVAARIVARALTRAERRSWYDREPPSIFVDLPPDEFFERECRKKARNEETMEKAATHKDVDGCPSDGKNPYVLRMAWPTFRLDREPVHDIRILAGGRDAGGAGFHADLSDAVVRDFEEERTLVVARTVARAVSKMALTKGVENSVDGDEAWVGRVLGALTNLGTALLEQADTRSWQLLPARIEITRLRLPTGTHQIALDVPVGSHGGTRRVVIGTAEVRADRPALMSARVWH